MSYTLKKRIRNAELLLDDLYDNPDFDENPFFMDEENNDLEAVRRIALQRKDAAEKKNNNSKDSAFYRNIIDLIDKRNQELIYLADSEKSPSPPPIQRRPVDYRAQRSVRSLSGSPRREPRQGRERSPARGQSGSPATTRRNNRGGKKRSTRKRSTRKRSTRKHVKRSKA